MCWVRMRWMVECVGWSKVLNSRMCWMGEEMEVQVTKGLNKEPEEYLNAR